MDIEKFTKIADEEANKMPQEFYNGLNGGIIVEEKKYLSENAINNDLYVLGRYTRGPIGNQITLYYGSFMQVFPYLTDDQMRDQINHTIRHEFRHHLENMAGIYGKDSLEEEDRQAYQEYLQKNTK
jgi:predicted Zn-dependent protease with MMP-like domain